jgi:hypothetical protein
LTLEVRWDLHRNGHRPAYPQRGHVRSAEAVDEEPEELQQHVVRAAVMGRTLTEDASHDKGSVFRIGNGTRKDRVDARWDDERSRRRAAMGRHKTMLDEPAGRSIARRATFAVLHMRDPEFQDLARDEFRVVTRDMSYLFALARLAIGAVTLQRLADARVLYGLLRPYSGYNALNSLFISLGAVSHFLGVLARFLGMQTEAARHLEEALAMNAALGHKVHALRTQLALAELLREQSSSASTARARSLAEAALTAARALGTTALAAKAAGVAGV